MRHFSRDDWYLEGFTWCGIDKEGKEKYPVSYGDNGMAWAMTTDVQQCMNLKTVRRVKDQLRAHMKHDPFFMHRYVKVKLVYIKEYPTFYFGYEDIARKLKIKINNRWNNEELEQHLMKYGFERISDNPKIIVVGMDDGETFCEVVKEVEAKQHKIKDITVRNSCFGKPTYLLRSVKDLELLIKVVPGCNEIANRYDDEVNGFTYLSGDIFFPCFAVVDMGESQVYSVDEVRDIANGAKNMLKLI